MAAESPQHPVEHRSPAVAAGLSFIWPGLGHWYLGRSRSAVVYALPVIVVLVLLGAELTDGLTVFAARLLDPSFSLTLLTLIVLIGLWRLVAIVDAARTKGPGEGLGRRIVARTGVLLALVVAMHGGAALVAYSFYGAGSQIFVGGEPDGPVGSVGPNPGPTDDYRDPVGLVPRRVPPFATPDSVRDRITVLLTGVDKTSERSHSLTDTLLVLSMDPETGAIAMVSFPRDLSAFPLYDGGTYDGKINSLMSYAARHPDRFPDGPMPTLAKELSFLLGVQINYFAAIDLEGFELMIEAAGGVVIDVERPITDPRYDWLDGSPQGFYLPAGRTALDARTALAYVRSRYGIGDSDFTRAARQQQVLIALREQLTNPANVPNLPGVLDAAAKTIRTNFPPERIGEIAELLNSAPDGSIRRVVLQPPTYSHHPPTSSTGGTYTLRLHVGALRALSVELFGEDSAFWTGSFDASGAPIPAAAR